MLNLISNFDRYHLFQLSISLKYNGANQTQISLAYVTILLSIKLSIFTLKTVIYDKSDIKFILPHTFHLFFFF